MTVNFQLACFFRQRFAVGAHEEVIKATVVVDCAQGACGDAHADRLTQRVRLQAYLLHVRHEATLSFAVGVRYGVARKHTFFCNCTTSSHRKILLSYSNLCIRINLWIIG